MTQFSQGEWIPYQLRSNNISICTKVDLAPALEVASLNTLLGYETTIANALLISAAPDMYEALKRLLSETSILNNEECDHDVGICWCSYKNARFMAEHALQKTEGKGGDRSKQ